MATEKGKEQIIAGIEFSLRYIVDNYVLLPEETICHIRQRAVEIYGEVETRVLKDNHIRNLDA